MNEACTRAALYIDELRIYSGARESASRARGRRAPPARREPRAAENMRDLVQIMPGVVLNYESTHTKLLITHTIELK